MFTKKIIPFLCLIFISIWQIVAAADYKIVQLYPTYRTGVDIIGAINDKNQIVGTVKEFDLLPKGKETAVLWDIKNRKKFKSIDNIPATIIFGNAYSSTARDINQHGMVVGKVQENESGVSVGFLWNSASNHATKFSPATEGNIELFKINNKNSALGYYKYYKNGKNEPKEITDYFIREENGQITHLSDINRMLAQKSPNMPELHILYDLNDNGIIVAGSLSKGHENKLFIGNMENGFVPIEIDKDPYSNSLNMSYFITAYTITQELNVLGSFIRKDNSANKVEKDYYFIWSHKKNLLTKLTAYNLNPENIFISKGFLNLLDMNNNLDIVGMDLNDNAILYKENSVHYLNDHIPEGTNWWLTSADAINNKGFISGRGKCRPGDDKQNYERQTVLCGYLLIPEE